MALLSPIFSMVSVFTDLLQPVLLASIIDQGIMNGDVTFILMKGMQMIGIAFIGLASGFFSTVLSSRTGQNFGADIRAAIFKKVQTFSFANLDEFKTASLVTRLTNDVSQVQNIVLMSLRLMIRAPLICIGGLIMAISINGRLALILLVAVPLLGITNYFIIKKSFPLFYVVQEKLDRLNALMRENLAGVRVVKAFVRGDLEQKRFGIANDEYRSTATYASRVVALMMPLIMLIMNLSSVAVIWFGGLQVNAGTMQVGQVLAFINYMSQILFSLTMVGFIFVSISRARASSDRLVEVLNTEVDITDTEESVEATIKTGHVVFENVSFSYTVSPEPVLDNISFEAKPGETVAILGGTGAGKSTLVNLIPRLYDPTHGRILIDGHDIRTIRIDSLRNAVSMVLQDTILFSGTIRDNIRWGKEAASDEEVEHAAKLAQAHGFILECPQQYDTILGQRGVNLSGGQKQRIAIARALIKKPPILILDDSTSSVDVATEARIQQALNKELNSTTVFIIAQRISSVINADKILVLENGKIVGEGTHGELLKTNPVYQEIYQSQQGGEVA